MSDITRNACPIKVLKFELKKTEKKVILSDNRGVRNYLKLP